MIASPTRVRRAHSSDAQSVASILTQGFVTDPVFEWMFPDPATRLHYTSAFFDVFTGGAIEAGDTFVSDDNGCAAIWFPVDPAAEPADESALMEALAEAVGPNIERLAIIDELMKAAHPHDAAHSYLNFVSTIPARQGQGLGREVLSQRLRELDAAGLPAYLEATTLRSAQLYASLGFEHFWNTIKLPAGPTMWPMWREPHG